MARKKETKAVGRPEIPITADQLEKLGALHPSLEEVAAFFDCTKRTIINRLKAPDLKLAFENGKLKGKLGLRRLQLRHANGTGSAAVNMTIHLSKHWLGQTDKTALELSGKDGGPIETKDVSARNIIASRIASIAARAGAAANPVGADGGAG